MQNMCLIKFAARKECKIGSGCSSLVFVSEIKSNNYENDFHLIYVQIIYVYCEESKYRCLCASLLVSAICHGDNSAQAVIYHCSLSKHSHSQSALY